MGICIESPFLLYFDMDFTDTIDLSKVDKNYMQGVLLYESAMLYAFDSELNFNKNKYNEMGLAFAFYSQAVSTSNNATMVQGWNEAARYYNLA